MTTWMSTKENSKSYERALENRSIDVTRARAAGQILFLDAEEVLSMFMVNDLPNPAKFQQVIGGKIEEMLKKFPRVRAYGEMVNLLWKQRKEKGTVELERLWNSLSETYAFSLLCSYSYDENLKKNGKCLSDICTAHTHYISVDGDLFTKVQTH